MIVQGGVTSGLLNAVVAEELPGRGSDFLHVDCSFKAPARPGDEITAEVEVLETRQDKPLTELRTTITNQTGTVVLDGNALVDRAALSLVFERGFVVDSPARTHLCEARAKGGPWPTNWRVGYSRFARATSFVLAG